MADQLQLRGGKTAQSQSFVGAEREITIDTELFAVRLHDGTTPGGHIIASLDTIQWVAATQSASFSTDLSSETTDREAAIAALQAAVNQAIADRTAADAATVSRPTATPTPRSERCSRQCPGTAQSTRGVGRGPG